MNIPSKHHRPGNRLKQGFYATALLGVVALASGLFFPQAGKFLVVEDRFAYADVALVLSGLPISRSFAARDLYRQGRVGQVWIIPEPANKIEGEVVKDYVKAVLVKQGLVDLSLPQWAERILIATGVPKSRITVLSEANGTINEAEAVRAFSNGKPPNSLVLITSKSASRRARLIFREVFRKSPIKILAYPTPYDSFEPNRWWRQPRNALTVVTEYQKLLVNALTLALHRN